ncbi:transposase [Halomicronema sp. CCY15110]|uniref:transposase n=1 Tax=Halomicronema sp. CCY15110 TaxID=2767773 RepID=UPI00194EB583|nr:transposase [Halomicronema sp. CCY15110]
MLINPLFEQFVEASPVSIMVRALMERGFAAEALDDLFERTAEKQYTRELLFSTVVSLMSLVVSQIHPSVNAAYKAFEQRIGVSKPAFYSKLNGLEPGIAQALVRYSYEQLSPLVQALGMAPGSRLAGYTLRIADGNHLGATEHRLAVLQATRSGPLPGQSIAVLDPEQMLVTDVFPCEDGHAQERSLTPALLATVEAKQVWIMDRNFCTRPLLFGLASQGAYWITRAHQQLPWQPLTPLQWVGTSQTGEVFEQTVQITDESGCSLVARRLVVQLHQPTRQGDSEVAIFTHLPASVVDAVTVTDLYLERWSVEGMFQIITDVFACELKTLGYPRAALFVFCIAVMAFNILATVKAALKSVHGVGKIEAGLSDFYVVEEVQGTFRGMMIALPDPLWQPFGTMPLETFADSLKAWAAKVNLKRFSSSPRGPKKPPKKDNYNPKHPHVSTAKLLEEKQNKRSP